MHVSALSIYDSDWRAMGGDNKVLFAEHLVGIHNRFRDPRAQIRLIRFEPVESGDIISASLETWGIKSEPQYNAISYAWGEPSDHHAITLNGVHLPVCKNCFHALRQARLHYSEQYAWSDAICINQLDLDEKSAQVAMRDGIYAKALLVLACIGPSDAFIRTANELYGTAIFQGTPDWGDTEQEGVWTVDMHTWSFTWEPKSPTDGGFCFPSNAEDESLIMRLCSEWNELSKRRYFHQLGIVQELSAGRNHTTILCGQDAMDWTRVVSLGWRLHRLNSHPLTSKPKSYLNFELMILNGRIHGDDCRVLGSATTGRVRRMVSQSRCHLTGLPRRTVFRLRNFSQRKCKNIADHVSDSLR
jgi:hypothetical protein